MGSLRWVRDLLPGSTLVRSLDALRAVYREADRRVASWASESGLACPPGCGVCCQRFEPDLLPLEADYLAAYLLHEAPDLLGLLEESPPGKPSDASPCPLYDPAEPHHCRVYPARPLICRLFGFSGVRGKDGRPLFRPCPHARPIQRESFLRLPSPPMMEDYGRRLYGPGAGLPRTRPLRPALRGAAGRIGLLRRLSALSGRESSAPPDSRCVDAPGESR
jgi:Fe-S-cluster containining protein